MSDALLQTMITEFNQRRFAAAGRAAAEALTYAQGRDEVFWQGICEACEGYACLMAGRLPDAEHKLVAAMQSLRDFGYRYQNFEIPVALAGIRAAVAEIRAVRKLNKRIFDVTLLPQLRLAAKADD
jgi:hypothetical protein